MNITLSADQRVIELARTAARRQGKSLNQLVRDYLDQLAARARGDDAAQKLFALMDAGEGDLEGRTWTRDEIHER